MAFHKIGVIITSTRPTKNEGRARFLVVLFGQLWFGSDKKCYLNLLYPLIPQPALKKIKGSDSIKEGILCMEMRNFIFFESDPFFTALFRTGLKSEETFLENGWIGSHSCPMAFFVFLAAAAGAGLVAPNFFLGTMHGFWRSAFTTIEDHSLRLRGVFDFFGSLTLYDLDFE